MNPRLLFTWALLVAAAAPAAAGPQSLPPRPNELWIGMGSASSFEAQGLEAIPGSAGTANAAISLGYMRNINERWAVGVALYGTSQDELETPLAADDGSLVPTPVNLYTYNFGVRVRYTLMPGRVAPYGYAGINTVFGEIDKPDSEDPLAEYEGYSACFGPGLACQLGRSWKVSAEGVFSSGSAQWKEKPYPGGQRRFDPSFNGLLVTFSWQWGR